MKFKQIVILDNARLSDFAMRDLSDYSEKSIKIFDSDSKTIDETKERLKEADCILLSWRTTINKEVLSVSTNLKFICLCGTNSNSIDLEECKKQNVVVSNVVDYGDEGVVEFIFLELLKLVKGFGKYKWKNSAEELSGKTFGIIGLGVVGKLLAKAAQGFNMKVLYTAKTRKPELENENMLFKDKKEILMESDIISLQTPKNIKILDKEDFAIINGKILVNTTLGKAFDINDFKEWIIKPNNFAIMDSASDKDFFDEFNNLDRVIFSDFIAGLTKEAIDRLSRKVLENVSSFLEGNSINVIN